MVTTVKYRFRVRRRTAASWTTIDEILLDSEIGRESDTGRFKLGDGVTAWNALPYFGDAASLLEGDGIEIDASDPANVMVSLSGAALALLVLAGTALQPGSFALDDLADVTAPSPTTADVLTWNGSAWVPDAPTGGGGGGSDAQFATASLLDRPFL